MDHPQQPNDGKDVGAGATSSANLKEAISGRLKAVRHTLGITQQELCAAVDLPISSLRNYELAKQVPGGEALLALKSIGVSADWLLSGVGEMLLNDQGLSSDIHINGKFTDGFTLVPRYGIDADAEVGRLAFRRDWLKQKGLSEQNLVVVRVSGDSMSPTIRDNALTLVDTSYNNCYNGHRPDGVYIIISGVVMAKRLQTNLTGGMYVCSDNPAYQPQHLTEQEASKLIVVGKVVWAGGEI